MGCYTNISLPERINFLERCITDYKADGFLINSIKSCNSFSAGQLLIMRELESRLGVPVSFIESDLVDPRYFSYANIKNRLDSFFQMMDQRKRVGGRQQFHRRQPEAASSFDTRSQLLPILETSSAMQEGAL
jgi:benzoyl-CoA reductase subunit B